MSGPAGRVTRGAGKDTAGFGGGGTAAPPADMLPLLRLRALPPPPPPPASRLRLPGLAAAAAADPVRGVQACSARKGCGHGPSADKAPPRHVGTGECASALAPRQGHQNRCGAPQPQRQLRSPPVSSDHLLLPH